MHGEIRKKSQFLVEKMPLISKAMESFLCIIYMQKYICIQSTLVILNSKGLSEILQDIRSSTYQVFRIEEKIIRLITFTKLICK